MAACQQQSKPKSKAHLGDAAVSTRAVYQPLSSKQNHIWSNCISPAGHINRVQQSKSTSGAAVYHQRGISIAISKARALLAQLCINSNHNTKRKHRWTTRLCRPACYINRDQQIKSIPGAAVYINSTVYQPRSAKGNAIWRNCISTARNINCSQHSGSISGAAVYQQPSKA